MRVLARIPVIETAGQACAAAPPREAAADERPPAATAPETDHAPADPAVTPVDEPRRRSPARGERGRGRREPTFPLRSAVALGILAAVAWSLASWSEQQRLARHRQERMARMSQAFTPQGTTR